MARDLLKLGVAVLVPVTVGFVGSVATASGLESWYPALAKPALNPPSWVFAPVWTILYVLMGVAAFLVWRRGSNRRDVRTALGLFALQLVMNGAWSFFFFGMQNPLAALVDLVALAAAIMATMVAFGRVSRTAAWLLVPYLVWVLFAGYLNAAIAVLN